MLKKWQVIVNVGSDKIDQLSITLSGWGSTNVEMHILLLDFKQSYDSISRSQLFRTMIMLGIRISEHGKQYG
jgi:hypothetical protein